MTGDKIEKLNVLILIPFFIPGYKMGGPLKSILHIIKNLSSEFSFKVITSDRDMGDSKPYENITANTWVNKDKFQVYYAQSGLFKLFNIVKQINAVKPDVLYLNDIFHPTFSISIVFLAKIGIIKTKNILIAPRGETFDKALKFKKTTKRIYIKFAKVVNLYKNVHWHASTEIEKTFIIKNIGVISQDIQVAINLPDNVESEIYPITLQKEIDTLYLVFIARISKSKNLIFTFEVLNKIKTKVIFDIYGPIEDEYIWKDCQEKIKNLPANIVVNFKGSLSIYDVKKTYAQYDLTFFPTLTENYGHSIVESLQVGTPVLISENTPWRNLSSQEFGWDISLSRPDLFVLAIEKMAKYSEDEKAVNRKKIVKDFHLILHNPKDLEANKKLFYNTFMSNKNYQICSKTIMDTTDPNIIFDSEGVSDYYHNFHDIMLQGWHPNDEGHKMLMKIAEDIKNDGEGKAFDCIIGLSGGLDSSYVTYVAKEVMGLRPLLFHVDAGWNTDQAVSNIEKLVDGLGLDLYTEVINWEEMKDLQVAVLKSGIADQDLPQDYAFFSTLYMFARKNKIKHVLTGSNISTECCREPMEWGGYGPGIDTTLILDIHKKFGKKALKTFPLIDILVYKAYYMTVLGMKVIKPLNYVPFAKKDAEDFLEKRFGWQRFQHKHHESRFTRFYEDYWLPRKFGFEKRRAHFSSLILTGQMSREAALERIAKPEMDEQFLKQEFEYVANKLDLSVAELQAIFDAPNKSWMDYKNKKKIISLGTKVLSLFGSERRLFR